MSLIEVLISMFVMLFGLMGVAAIFPVGNYYVIEGEKFDLASGIAQNAFEELRARGVLRPDVWLYADVPPGTLGTTVAPRSRLVIEDSAGTNPGAFNVVYPPNTTDPQGPGHAFVIDPLGADQNSHQWFPFNTAPGNPWNAGDPTFPLTGSTWPVRRITLPTPDPTGTFPFISMPSPVAETIFRLRDDLAVEQPDESDRPSIQRWDTADIDPFTGNSNNTPKDLTDDSLLRRQYKGDYSWLATIVPTTGAGLEALQPANADYGEISCDVSIVIFRKRDETPSLSSERLIEAELLQGGELVIYSTSGTLAKEAVDDAVDDIRPGNWISLMGVNQTTGDFVMKWYRILSLDDETIENEDVSTATGQFPLRRAMLIGPDWPAPTGGATVVTNLRAGFFPGAISVVTKPLRMEATSLWKLE